MKRSILITGASGGIGAELCEHFLEKDYHVIGLDIKKQDHIQCSDFIAVDIADAVNIFEIRQLLHEEITSSIGGSQFVGLVNNAAVQKLSRLSELTLDDFQNSIKINVTGPLMLIKMLSDILEKHNGTVVNIGSIHAQLTKPGFISYATSKAALRGLTKSVAVDAGNRFSVCLIEPAAIDTQMLRAGFEGNDAAFASLEAHHPSESVGTPKNICTAVEYLIAHAGSFSNGCIINIDGGISARLHDPE